jgi:hypothetical protein
MPAKEQKRAERYSVFLNIPYDSAFENLYLAYIARLGSYPVRPWKYPPASVGLSEY